MTPLSASTLDTNPPAAADPPAPGRTIGLTVWLVWLLFLNAVAALVLPVVGAAYNSLGPPDPASSVWLFAPTVLAVINIACVVALFKNKKWGFWGLCITSGLFAVPIYKLGGGREGAFGVMVAEFISLGILYALLNAGGEKSTWTHLR